MARWRRDQFEVSITDMPYRLRYYNPVDWPDRETWRAEQAAWIDEWGVSWLDVFRRDYMLRTHLQYGSPLQTDDRNVYVRAELAALLAELEERARRGEPPPPHDPGRPSEWPTTPTNPRRTP